MQIKVGSYFQDDSKDSNREFSIILDDNDGRELFPKNWDSWTVSLRYKKLRAMAEIYVLQYSASRGFRNTEPVKEEIDNIIAKDLK